MDECLFPHFFSKVVEGDLFSWWFISFSDMASWPTKFTSTSGDSSELPSGVLV